MKVFIFGAGKVGRVLAQAAKAERIDVELVPARKGLPAKPVRADLVVLAVRDRDVFELAEEAALRGIVSSRTAVVHVAGALDAEALAPLRGIARGVAQMHPMISFASHAAAPSLERGQVHVKGDPAAEHVAKRFVRRLGMTPRTFERLDTVGYHAAAAFVANGAITLAALGALLLEHSGVPARDAPRMLGPLLRSVAENVESLGFPHSLTGPVRRGDVHALEKHLAVLESRIPEAVRLYLASAGAQLPLARKIGDAPAEALDAIAVWLEKATQVSASAGR